MTQQVVEFPTTTGRIEGLAEVPRASKMVIDMTAMVKDGKIEAQLSLGRT
jgi:hypothetical protein